MRIRSFNETSIPIGIWRPVELILHDEVRDQNQPWIRTSLAGNAQSATVAIQWLSRTTAARRAPTLRYALCRWPMMPLQPSPAGTSSLPPEPLSLTRPYGSLSPALVHLGQGHTCAVRG